MGLTKPARRRLAALGAAAVAMVFGFAVVEYYQIFPWHMQGGVNYDGAVRLYTKKILAEHAISMTISLLAFVYQAFLLDLVVGTPPGRERLGNILLAVSAAASAGIVLLYGAMFMLMLRTIGPY